MVGNGIMSPERRNAQAMKGNSYFARKFHSLLGVIPLGLFIVEHAIANYTAFESGPEGFNKSVSFLNGLPLVLFLEIFGTFFLSFTTVFMGCM